MATSDTPKKKSNTTPTETTRSPLPKKEWPGAFGIYKYSRDAIVFNLWVYLALCLIPLAFSFVIDIAKLPEVADTILNYLISALFTVATTVVVLAAIRRKKVDLNSALESSFSLLSLKVIGLYLLLALILIPCLIVIIPFFFIAPRLALASYYLIDQELSITDSISASWRATKGHVGKVYGIIGVNLLMALLMLTIVGIPFSLYFLFVYNAAMPLLYQYIQKHPSKAATTT